MGPSLTCLTLPPAASLSKAGDAVATLKGHTGITRAVALATDGTLVVSGAEDGTVRFWDPRQISDSDSNQTIRSITDLPDVRTQPLAPSTATLLRAAPLDAAVSRRMSGIGDLMESMSSSSSASLPPLGTRPKHASGYHGGQGGAELHGA